MDIVYITGLKAETIIGIHDWEREQRQTVLIDLELGCDTTRPARSDDISYFEQVGIAFGRNMTLGGDDGEPARVGVLEASSSLLELLGAFPSPAGGEQLIHGILDHALHRDDWFHRGPVEALLHGFTEARNAGR